VQVFKTKEKIERTIKTLKNQNTTIGLVPTMGALHAGHLSLIENGLNENDKVVVSIFVNPTQFNKKEDLEKYPRTLYRDIELLKTVSKDKIIVFSPSVKEVYENSIASLTFNFDGLELEMEGKFREGHFDGVGTIVKRLFEIVKPHNAYFGEKDFQQLQIIKKLVEKHNLPVNVIGCEIYRESNGLAMSSRNEILLPKHKKEAPFIYKTLQTTKTKFKDNSANKIMQWVVKEFANNTLLELEYFIIADVNTLKPTKRKSRKKQYRAFIAVYAGKVRLIDNIALN
jgi:pantoate--beta-alanine ligase